MAKPEPEPSGLQRGATLERKAIKAKVKRLKKKYPPECEGINALDELIQYIDDREIRTGRRRGGL